MILWDFLFFRRFGVRSCNDAYVVMQDLTLEVPRSILCQQSAAITKAQATFDALLASAFAAVA